MKRTLLLSIWLLLMPGAFASKSQDNRIKNYDLDVHKVYEISTAEGVVTTIVFPENIESIDGRGFVVDPEKQHGKFVLGFTPKTNFISISPLDKDVIMNCNIGVAGEIYSFELKAVKNVSEASFKVIFSNEYVPILDDLSEKKVKSFDLATSKATTPARIISFIDRVNLIHLDPKAEQDNFLVSHPQKKYDLGVVNMTLLSVHRDNDLDALCFHLELESKDGKEHYYDIQDFQVQVGDRIFQQFTSRASGVIPKEGKDEAYFVIVGDGTDGGRNDLAPTSEWQIRLNLIDASQRQDILMPSMMAPSEGLLPVYQEIDNFNPPHVRHEK